MIKGNTVFEGSVSGFSEKVSKGITILNAKKVVFTSGTKKSDKVMYNVSEMVGGVPKEIYFPTPTNTDRPFTHIETRKAILQDFSHDSVATDDPTDSDLSILDYTEAFSAIAAVALKAEGLDPNQFPIKYASMSSEGRLNVWYASPASDKSKFKWDFDTWMASAGVATFKVSGVLIQRASQDPRAEHRDNYVSLYLKLGQFKHDANFDAKQAKRKIAYEKGETQVALPKVPVVSEAAKKRRTNRPTVTAEDSVSKEDTQA